MASKSYRKFMATGLTAAVVASAVAPVAGAASFSDVKPGSWYEGAVNYVSENGYMKGTDKGFEPKKSLTRAEAAGIFANRFDLYDTNLEADFSDVKSGAWYHNAVAAVKVNKIMGSTGNDMFSPDRKITRGEMAALIVRAYGFKVEGEVEHTFTDIKGNMFENDIATLVAWGITNGKTDKLFAPGDTVSRAEMAAFIQKADEALEAPQPMPLPKVDSVKAVDATSVEVTLEGTYTQEEVNALIEAGYELTVVAGDDVHEVGKVTVKAAEASTSADTTTLVLSEISPELPAGVDLRLAVNGEVVEGTEFKYEAPATPEVTSVSAIAAKKVEVKFANPVVDTTKAAFTVKKGSSTIGVANIEWNEDKTAAHLELSSKLSAGKYDVSVAGLAETALTGSVQAENERADEVKVLSTDLVSTDATYDKDDINSAVVGYQLFNQYGEEITKEASLGNVTNGFDVVASTGSAVFSNGVLTWTGNAVNAEGSKVVLTLVNKVTAESSSVTLTLAKKSTLSTWELGGVFHLDGKTPSEDDTTGFNLLLSAQDQYGKKLTDDADLDTKFTIVSSNPSVITVSNDILDNIQVDKNDSTKVETGVALTVGNPGVATITVVENSTGKSLSYKVTVAEGKKVDVVTIGNPDGIVAGQETIKLPLDVLNNKGEVVTTESLIEAGITVAASQNGDPITIGAAEIKVVDGKAFLEFTTEAVATGTENLVINITSATNKVTTKTIQVKADAVATTLVGLKSTVSKSVYKTATYTLADFVVEDQHGRVMDTTTLAGHKIVATDYDAATTGALEISNDATVDSRSKGSELVKFALVNTTTGDEVSAVDTTLKTVVASDFVNYEVVPVETLYYNGDTAGSLYGEKFVVNGIAASGEKVALSEGGDYVLSLPTGISLEADGKLYADSATVGVDADASTTDVPQNAEFDAKITLNINDGREIAFKVKVSADAPKVSTLNLQDADEKAVDSFTFTGGTVAAAAIINEIEKVIVAKDQYGEEIVVGAPTAGNDLTFATTTPVTFTFKVVSRDDKNGDLVVTNNGTSTISVAGLDATETVTVEVTTGAVTKVVKLVGSN
ncbi:S-layer homology domain-containing protein [Fictibacillus phosphorivorans]|uniref:S-layer homology domain-containing protein n=1 Tax=Fictibacillus phosphorivorans TaxID=1221500 RepID=UPI0020410D0A|nr:S-layer homology domain-containing protein [Fictibacillus phosphorivorans]MCM3718518.1 S-layer homology domain-containing protein [Fictibacillus phosphorivorans]MCM3776126.1 S-layer homology domain-containing protein [Fictibacillus phosphorivorans]